jgi:hypothetical protein
MLVINGDQASARRPRDARLWQHERARRARAVRQEEVRRTHGGSDSEQSGGVRGRVGTSRLTRDGIVG